MARLNSAQRRRKRAHLERVKAFKADTALLQSGPVKSGLDRPLAQAQKGRRPPRSMTEAPATYFKGQKRVDQSHKPAPGLDVRKDFLPEHGRSNLIPKPPNLYPGRPKGKN